MTFLNSFSGRGRTYKTDGGGLAPTSQTVGSLLRIPDRQSWSKLVKAGQKNGFGKVTNRLYHSVNSLAMFVEKWASYS
jgi:hypothetical protein